MNREELEKELLNLSWKILENLHFEDYMICRLLNDTYRVYEYKRGRFGSDYVGDFNLETLLDYIISGIL